jgi:ABC-type multidrug transport system ATPase subunit
MINGLSEGGTTVLVTTHMMDEAEYCNDIILINQGRLIAGGSPTQLKTEHIRLPILEVTLKPAAPAGASAASASRMDSSTRGARDPAPLPPAETALAPRTLTSAALDFRPASGEDAGVIDALELIRIQPWAVETSVFGTKLHVMVAAEQEGASLIRRTLSDANVEVGRIEKIMPSLEDVFLYVLEHEQHNEPVSREGR